MNLMIFQDKNGINIYLSHERWRHITNEHPKVANKLEEINEALINPNVIRDSHYDRDVKYYYKYQKSEKQYLFVIVKYLNNRGYIITSYYVDIVRGIK